MKSVPHAGSSLPIVTRTTGSGRGAAWIVTRGGAQVRPSSGADTLTHGMSVRMRSHIRVAFLWLGCVAYALDHAGEAAARHVVHCHVLAVMLLSSDVMGDLMEQ